LADATSAVIVESAADETACLVPDTAAARHALERFADELDGAGADAHRIPASDSRAPGSAESQGQQIKLSVEGQEAEFVLLRSNGSWAATAVLRNERLTVVGNAFDPSRLSLVGVEARTGRRPSSSPWSLTPAASSPGDPGSLSGWSSCDSERLPQESGEPRVTTRPRTLATLSTRRVDLPEAQHLELPVEELLSRGRPLPSHEEMVIEDLGEEEGVAFLEVVRS
jgi:hypothetical protein